MRALSFEGGARVGVHGTSTSLFYAKHWLESVGLHTANVDDVSTTEFPVVLEPGVRGSALGPTVATEPEGCTRIELWDFHTSHDGTGFHAAAASGVSWVIGHADGVPRSLPVDIPEKWCGLVAANLALACLLDHHLRGPGPARHMNVSAADVLRSFADQNAGNHLEVDQGWRRNGSIAVEHGGIYPQGFFPCRDGHVAMVGRSRNDWRAIRDVIGRPAWTDEARFDDPFVLASDSSEVDELLSGALELFDRDELLDRSLETGATLAPVYAAEELDSRGILRSGFLTSDGHSGLPFEIVPVGAARPAATGSVRKSHVPSERAGGNQ